MNKNYQGFYINLDRRPDRRAQIEAELARYGLSDTYRRFRAVEGNGLRLSNPHIKEGEMGCFASHYMVLKENRDQDIHLHLIEDDAIFAPTTAQTINGIINQGLFADYDIIYTDVLIPLLNDAYKSYKGFYDATVKRDSAGRISKAVFTVINLKDQLFGSTSSYLVNKNSIKKVHDLYEQEITNEPRKSIDLFIRRMSNEEALKVGCIFPFVTSVRLDHIVETDIVRPYHEMSALATHLARYSFFIGADFDLCQGYLDKYMPLPSQVDKHTQILRHLLMFSLTDKYRPF
jgi:GR25 family glycosyltransferase involved in LPS biosynthesis